MGSREIAIAEPGSSAQCSAAQHCTQTGPATGVWRSEPARRFAGHGTARWRGSRPAHVAALLLAAALGCTLESDRTFRDDQLLPEERRRIEVFRRACPSVVHVETFDVRRDPTRFNVLEIPVGMGSGFVWDRDGHVVTNLHVIRGAERARVSIKDGRSWTATVMGSDRDRDVAVLMIDAPTQALVPLEVRLLSTLRVGQTVLAIGNPFGLDHTLTVGVVSALGREVPLASGSVLQGAIQVDAAINPGSSGGPLLDSAGRLVGINTAFTSSSGAFAGIGFAVPVEAVEEAVSRILGRIPPLQPGLGIRAAEDAWVRELGLSGVLVMEVVPGGSAAAAGVRPTRTGASGDLELGDLIVAIDGEAVGSRAELMRFLSRAGAGDLVKVTVRRGQDSIELQMRLALEGHPKAPSRDR